MEQSHEDHPLLRAHRMQSGAADIVVRSGCRVRREKFALEILRHAGIRGGHYVRMQKRPAVARALEFEKQIQTELARAA